MVLLRRHFEISYGFSLEKIIPHYEALDGLDWFGLWVQLWSSESSHLMLVAFNVTGWNHTFWYMLAAGFSVPILEIHRQVQNYLEFELKICKIVATVSY